MLRVITSDAVSGVPANGSHRPMRLLDLLAAAAAAEAGQQAAAGLEQPRAEGSSGLRRSRSPPVRGLALEDAASGGAAKRAKRATGDSSPSADGSLPGSGRSVDSEATLDIPAALQAAAAHPPRAGENLRSLEKRSVSSEVCHWPSAATQQQSLAQVQQQGTPGPAPMPFSWQHGGPAYHYTTATVPQQHAHQPATTVAQFVMTQPQRQPQSLQPPLQPQVIVLAPPSGPPMHQHQQNQHHHSHHLGAPVYIHTHQQQVHEVVHLPHGWAPVAQYPQASPHLPQQPQQQQQYVLVQQHVPQQDTVPPPYAAVPDVESQELLSAPATTKPPPPVIHDTRHLQAVLREIMAVAMHKPRGRPVKYIEPGVNRMALKFHVGLRLSGRIESVGATDTEAAAYLLLDLVRIGLGLYVAQASAQSSSMNAGALPPASAVCHPEEQSVRTVTYRPALYSATLVQHVIAQLVNRGLVPSIEFVRAHLRAMRAGCQPGPCLPNVEAALAARGSWGGSCCGAATEPLPVMGPSAHSPQQHQHHAAVYHGPAFHHVQHQQEYVPVHVVQREANPAQRSAVLPVTMMMVQAVP